MQGFAGQNSGPLLALDQALILAEPSSQSSHSAEPSLVGNPCSAPPLDHGFSTRSREFGVRYQIEKTDD